MCWMYSQCCSEKKKKKEKKNFPVLFCSWAASSGPCCPLRGSHCSGVGNREAGDFGNWWASKKGKSRTNSPKPFAHLLRCWAHGGFVCAALRAPRSALWGLLAHFALWTDWMGELHLPRSDCISLWRHFSFPPRSRCHRTGAGPRGRVGARRRPPQAPSPFPRAVCNDDLCRVVISVDFVYLYQTL